MKTFTMVYIKSNALYRSNATPETWFVRPLYAKSQHFRQKRYFIFSKITRSFYSKHFI